MTKLENTVCTSAKGEFDSINKSDQRGEGQWEQCWGQWERNRGLTGREWEEGEESSDGAGANTADSHCHVREECQHVQLRPRCDETSR